MKMLNTLGQLVIPRDPSRPRRFGLRAGRPPCFLQVWRDCTNDTAYYVFADGQVYEYLAPASADARTILLNPFFGSTFNDAFRRSATVDGGYMVDATIPGTATQIYSYPPYPFTDPGPCSSTTLSSYWTMELTAGNFVDDVGGFLIPQGTINTGTGIIGNCASMPGQYIVFGTPAGASMDASTTTGISFWCWLNLSAPLPGTAYVTLYFYELVSGNGFALQLNPATPTTLSFWVDPAPPVTWSAPFPTGGWHFVCAVWDKAAATFTLYVDAMVVATIAAPLASPSSGFFAPYWDEFNLSQLLVDEVGFSLTGPLTAAQVTSLFNGGAGVTWPAVKSIVPT
jgi:hypothetical protein